MASTVSLPSSNQEKARSPGTEWRRECQRPVYLERVGAKAHSHMSLQSSDSDQPDQYPRNVSASESSRETIREPHVKFHNGQLQSEAREDTAMADQKASDSEEGSRRSFGMHNILNPQREIADPNRRQLQPTPFEMLNRPGPRLPSPSGPPSQSSTLERISPPSNIAGGRRILTPRSPSLRASNIGISRGGPSAPEVTSNRSVLGQSIEPLATPRSEASPSPQTVSQRATFNFPSITESMPSHRTVSPRSGQLALPQLHAQPEPFRFGNPSQTPFTPSLPSPFSQSTSQSTHQLSSGGPSELQSETGSRTRQMYLDTAQGRIGIEVEVDTQAASRMADEKRRRNAGASARFRQRRKEKEREASHTIASLEADIKNMMEERDFYISERNFFRDLASRFTQAIPPRPSSPRSRRRHVPSEEAPSAWQTISTNPDTQTRPQGGLPGLPPGPLPAPVQPTALGANPQTLSLPPPIPATQQGPHQAPPSFSPPRPSLLPPTSGPATSQPPRSFPYDSLRKPEQYDRSWNPGP